VIGRNVVIHSGAEVRESVIMDNVDVGRGAKIRRAIIDKNVRILPGHSIGYDPEHDRQVGVVSPSGIVVLEKAPRVSGSK
jgi:glucose-1-phosphate adenylyltransferase